MKNAIALFFLVLVGCAAQEPPAYYSVDSEFSEAEAGVIDAAIADWCEAVGWCPEKALWSERGRFELVDDLPEGRLAACPEGRVCEVAGNNDGDVVRVARQRPAQDDLSAFWMVVAHEIGHFCTEHTERGLMAAYHEVDDALEIDPESVRAWHAGCP